MASLLNAPSIAPVSSDKTSQLLSNPQCAAIPQPRPLMAALRRPDRATYDGPTTGWRLGGVFEKGGRT